MYDCSFFLPFSYYRATNHILTSRKLQHEKSLICQNFERALLVFCYTHITHKVASDCLRLLFITEYILSISWKTQARKSCFCNRDLKKNIFLTCCWITGSSPQSSQRSIGHSSNPGRGWKKLNEQWKMCKSTISMFTRLTQNALIFSGGRSWPSPA